MKPASLPAERILLLAGLGSLALIAGALGFQYLGHLAPCEMCHWQRWPYIAAAFVGLLMTPLWKSVLRLPLVVLAILIAVAVLITAFDWGMLKGQMPGLLAITIITLLALVIAMLAVSLRTESLRILAMVAITLVALSGLIGAYQAGMAWHLLPGPSACTVSHPYVMGSNAPVEVRCDVPPVFFGLVLPAWNAIFSFLIAGSAAALLAKRR